MAVHILEPKIQKNISSQLLSAADENLENNPVRQKALSELKDIFDGYNEEINKYNKLELKKFEEESKKEKEQQKQYSLENEEYNKKIMLMCNIYDTCRKIVENLQKLEASL